VRTLAPVCAQERVWLPLVAEIAELEEGEADDAANRPVNGPMLLRLTASLGSEPP